MSQADVRHMGRRIGLRIDADTFCGTRDGIPHLLSRFEAYDIQGTFFFCVGPDNMGRHLWRLLKPAFLKKMLCSKAASIYDWSILFAGTAWPGRHIAHRLAHLMRACADAGHEVGLHVWDHQSWQAHMEYWPEERLEQEIRKGLTALEDALGRPVTCSAAPGWRADTRVLDMKERIAARSVFRYNSDCRGSGPFRPLLSDGRTGTVQIPVTLPTFDEVAGRLVDESGYNKYILNTMENALRNTASSPVYTIHAEVEGVSRRELFEDLLMHAVERQLSFRPLGELLPDSIEELPVEHIVLRPFPGREGTLAQQSSSVHPPVSIV